jgi:hypothetical protein
MMASLAQMDRTPEVLAAEGAGVVAPGGELRVARTSDDGVIRESDLRGPFLGLA